MHVFQSRVFIGTILFLAFLVMLVTSVQLFSQHHNPITALTHTILGFTLLLVILWHLKKNIRSLVRYLNPLNRFSGKRNLTMPLASIVIIGLVLATTLQLPIAVEVYRFSQTLKASDEITPDNELKFVIRDLEATAATGQKLTIELKKGPYFIWPQYALWIETLEGELVQPLYVTEKLATNNFVNKVSKIDPNQVFSDHLLLGNDANPHSALTFEVQPETKNSRLRPESLPVFLHKLAANSDDNQNTDNRLNNAAPQAFYAPTDSELQLDGYTGATLLENFVLTTQLKTKLTGQYRIRFEINHSFDYNDYYSSDRFPDDPIYSGDGYSAQPSVVYEAIINFDDPTSLSRMQVIGRGHHSGKDGTVYTDLENLSTALELVERVLVFNQG